MLIFTPFATMVAACDIYQPKNSSLSFLVVGHLLRLQLMTFIDLRIEVTQSFVIFRPLRASDHLVGQLNISLVSSFQNTHLRKDRQLTK